MSNTRAGGASGSDQTDGTARPSLLSTISIAGIDPISLLGPADANLRVIARHYKTQVVVRDDSIKLVGPAEETTELRRLFDRLLERCRNGAALNPDLVEAEIDRLRNPVPDTRDSDTAHSSEPLTIHAPRKTIVAKTKHQQVYLNAIQSSDVVFAIGPAGTGKTYLAVAAAVQALVSGRAGRIILTRPAVEAGESLGYLPGTFKDKVDPYLRPLYDALFDMMPMERALRLIEQDVVEVAPLAFMRGRTLSEAYVILDEAQNTTVTQMKMFLTRLGWNSKSIITGDVTQIDLAQPQGSGLLDAEKRLRPVSGIAFVHFDETDVVRPRLVSRIISAYENRGP